MKFLITLYHQNCSDHLNLHSSSHPYVEVVIKPYTYLYNPASIPGNADHFWVIRSLLLTKQPLPNHFHEPNNNHRRLVLYTVDQNLYHATTNVLSHYTIPYHRARFL